MKRIVLAVAATLAPVPALAQFDCFPSKSSNEAKTFAIFSVPLAFAPAGAPSAATGRLRIGLEVAYLPNVDPAIATPTTCRPGKGPENTDLLFAAPRPRVELDLGRGLAIEGSWLPPHRLNGVRANLFGVALAWSTGLGATHNLTLRGHGTFGRIQAPITCDDDDIAEPGNACYQGERSDDRFWPNIAGIEGIVSWSLKRLYPYVGLGYNRLMPRFQVQFRQVDGYFDNRRVEVDLDRGTIFGGATFAATSRIGLSGEIYAAPSDVVTTRFALRIGLGN